eukprot:354316-Chlamydomonas_euryale.AAC.2
MPRLAAPLAAQQHVGMLSKEPGQSVFIVKGVPKRQDTGVPARLRGQLRRCRLIKTLHSAWNVDRLGRTGCCFIDPLGGIVGYPTEHPEVFDCTQAGDRGHVGAADLVILSLERMQWLVPVHCAPAGAGLQL